ERVRRHHLRARAAGVVFAAHDAGTALLLIACHVLVSSALAATRGLVACILLALAFLAPARSLERIGLRLLGSRRTGLHPAGTRAIRLRILALGHGGLLAVFRCHQ